ncbi:MAG: hypothetical protein JW742_01720 [Candidatus Aminicenantes bacterium]|nr:hypothetical protein [Candidatus Aminicenantes bacterium]
MKTGGGLIFGLLITVVVIFVLLFVKTGEKSHVVAAVDALQEAGIATTRANLSQLEQVVVSFVAGEGRSPESWKELRSLRYIMAGATDGWGRAIRYEKTSDEGFRLVSAGPDGAFDTADDIAVEDEAEEEGV